MEIPFGSGALESAKDYRTLDHAAIGLPQIKSIGGLRYPASIIMHQHKIGICTAISLVQNVRMATGVLYSEDFQYLLQKKFIDGDWMEGSSPFSAVKAAHKYGLLRAEYMPTILSMQPDISYPDYVSIDDYLS